MALSGHRIAQAVSAFGVKRTSAAPLVMSAYDPTAAWLTVSRGQRYARVRQSIPKLCREQVSAVRYLARLDGSRGRDPAGREVAEWQWHQRRQRG